MLTGKWTYRSFHNTDALVGTNAEAALQLIFGEGIFEFTRRDAERFGGTLNMGDGFELTLEGAVEPDDPAQFSIIGLGVPNTSTEGWRYDYQGGPGYTWPEGIDQVPSLVGTVVRVNAHGPTSPAGVTASFIAVRH